MKRTGSWPEGLTIISDLVWAEQVATENKQKFKKFNFGDITAVN